MYHYYSKRCILICENSKVNEAKIGEDTDDTKPISECTLDEQEMRRDDPRWIRKPDPPSTDRPPRSAEDAASAPDGSFAPRMQIYPDSALPPAHTNCRHT
ncbi:hypothetical protein T4D_4357 [Trichinella pseudospiralis]|uniref:Uncharacterized protein n=1 Tax=Trichinella pseudospiralis TaxID=6337 RepID=A0A0V1FKE6_TRIPS|nr:hypothetical protein T4D_4357 [Trichinella pseudospiralis]